MELLTLKDAAGRAGCSTKTLRNRIKSGELRALKKDGKHGPTFFVPEAELLRMMAIEPPGGRSAPTPQERSSTVSAQPSTVSTVDEQGSSTVPVVAPPAEAAQFSGDVILRLTDRLEQQAQELGRYKAITERAESLESRERELQTERDRLALELAQAKTELDVLRREQLRKGKRWFGIKRASTVPHGSSTVAAPENAGVS